MFMRRSVLLFLVGSAVVALACGSSSDSTPGEGSKDNPAANDVKITSCGPSTNQFLGMEVKGTVTNNSSKPSNYIITVAFENADASQQLDTGNASVQNLQAGQSAEFEASSTKAETKNVPGATCKVADVIRLSADG
jgi:hypothetical protein